MGPHLLRPDNLTPPARTPWGGRRIPELFKKSLGILLPVGPVGESWEVSVEPSFPSRLADTGEFLSEAIAAHPEAWLGAEVARLHGGALPLLVKLLDSADDLSVQVHPLQGHPGLGPGESGKAEAWLVLVADPGAGIYLGWRDGVGREQVEACLEASGDLNHLMNFVAVKEGDVYTISPGLPHAIGAGVTLLEPQVVTPGKRAVTYRYWDWNRRYDAEGRLDPGGEPRPLNAALAMDCTDWTAAGGSELPRTLGTRERIPQDGPMGRQLLLQWPFFRLETWEGSGSLLVPCPGTLWAITCLGGSAILRCSPSPGAASQVLLPCGQSAVIPAAAGDLQVEGDRAVLAAVRL